MIFSGSCALIHSGFSTQLPGTLSEALCVSVWEKPTLVYSRDSTEERGPTACTNGANRRISAAGCTRNEGYFLYPDEGNPINTWKVNDHILPPTLAEDVSLGDPFCCVAQVWYFLSAASPRLTAKISPTRGVGKSVWIPSAGRDCLVDIEVLCWLNGLSKKRFSFIFHPPSHHPCGPGRVFCPPPFPTYSHKQGGL